MDYSTYTYLDVNVRHDGICIVTLNRPDKLNACGIPEHDELARILRDLQRDDRVKVTVLAGRGRAFSVGGDISLLEAGHANAGNDLAEMMQAGREVVLSHVDHTKPVISAVHGYVMGAAAVFALLCDFIIVDRSAKIADGHIRAAIAAGDGGALIWPLSVGLVKAKRYLMTGDWVGAEEAERIGLITEVVDDGRCLDRALELADRLARGPQLAIRHTKIALNQWLRSNVSIYDHSQALECLTMVSAAAGDANRTLRETGRGVMPA